MVARGTAGRDRSPAERKRAPRCRGALSRECAFLRGLQVAGAGLAAIVGFELVADALVLIERAHAGLFDRADVYEGIAPAAFRLDEAIALVDIEEFHGAERHSLFLSFSICEAGTATPCVRSV